MANRKCWWNIIHFEHGKLCSVFNCWTAIKKCIRKSSSISATTVTCRHTIGWMRVGGLNSGFARWMRVGGLNAGCCIECGLEGWMCVVGLTAGLRSNPQTHPDPHQFCTLLEIAKLQWFLQIHWASYIYFQVLAKFGELLWCSENKSFEWYHSANIL